jgi:hypothetical protein
VFSRLAGRLVTGPGAFLVAGIVDVGALTLAYLRYVLAERRGGATPPS